MKAHSGYHLKVKRIATLSSSHHNRSSKLKYPALRSSKRGILSKKQKNNKSNFLINFKTNTLMLSRNYKMW